MTDNLSKLQTSLMLTIIYCIIQQNFRIMDKLEASLLSFIYNRGCPFSEVVTDLTHNIYVYDIYAMIPIHSSC